MTTAHRPRAQSTATAITQHYSYILSQDIASRIAASTTCLHLWPLTMSHKVIANAVLFTIASALSYLSLACQPVIAHTSGTCPMSAVLTLNSSAKACWLSVVCTPPVYCNVIPSQLVSLTLPGTNCQSIMKFRVIPPSISPDYSKVRPPVRALLPQRAQIITTTRVVKRASLYQPTTTTTPPPAK
jgi:hypothetical protein